MPADKDFIPKALELATTPASYTAVQLAAKKMLEDGSSETWPHNGCAANLSALLKGAGIGVPTTLGAGSLATRLGGKVDPKHPGKSRGWLHLSVGDQMAGDVGVTFDAGGNAGADHIYFVVECKGKDEMVVADNQATAPHTRFASGKAAPGGHKTTPTDYFLRAPGMPMSAIVAGMPLGGATPPPAAPLEKVLWVVNYDKLSWFIERAQYVGATTVAIRTDNDVSTAIKEFHKLGIKVVGWRWPSAKRDPAMKEANKAVALFGEGMDGYYVDPEGAKVPPGKPKKPYDWDLPGLEQLADDFCSTIVAAAGGKPFGTTSHYRGDKVHPRLPWAQFFKHSTVLLPQAYWRSTEGTIGHGDPADNYRVSLDRWEATGGKRELIVPMAGELGSATASEITAYAAAAAVAGINTLHFYTAEEEVSKGVWDAIRAL